MAWGQKSGSMVAIPESTDFIILIFESTQAGTGMLKLKS